MLYENKSDEISLAKEIAYIKKYIELHKIRSTNTSYINFTVNDESDTKATSKLIAPMLFVPFIENAFKHTTNKKSDDAISITIDIQADVLIFTCKNKFDPSVKKKNEPGGLGQELIKKRLQLIYPDQHDLNIDSRDGIYSVMLKVYNE
jgi:LytS/YehU family sensor histidine kinase